MTRCKGCLKTIRWKDAITTKHPLNVTMCYLQKKTLGATDMFILKDKDTDKYVVLFGLSNAQREEVHSLYRGVDAFKLDIYNKDCEDSIAIISESLDNSDQSIILSDIYTIRVI